ncbi:MAG: radical SAM protein [Thaumarchaeota archaeon]|nr:radical SAM protein [Nitrososphaerota archaeon]
MLVDVIAEPHKWWQRKVPVVEEKRCRTFIHGFAGEYKDEGGLAANPYVGCAHRCCYCYATYKWVPEFYDKIVVKSNAPQVLEAQLKAWKGKYVEPIFFASATDSYQPQEGRSRITRKCVEVMQKYGVPYYVFTKSGTILRDLELHASYKEKCMVFWSISTMDDSLKKVIEPNVTPTKSLLRVIKKFSEREVQTAVNIIPIIPGLTDDRTKLVTLVKESANAGARYFTAGVLRLRDDIWDRIKIMLESIGRQDVTRLMQALYYSKPDIKQGYYYAPKSYREEIVQFVESKVKECGAKFGIPISYTPDLDSPQCSDFVLHPKEKFEEASMLSFVQ